MKAKESGNICAMCEYAAPLFDSDTVLCQKKGVVMKDHHCRRFSYDPLKRVPPKTAEAPTLDYIDIDSED